MNEPLIQTCLFDMGNVLVHFSHERMCSNVAEVCGMDVQQATEMLIDSGLQWQMERGEVNEDEFHRTIAQQASVPVSQQALLHAAADIFWLNDSIVPLLEELRQLNMRLVLLSNTSVTHLNFIRQQFSVLDYFDDFATSFAAGALKPDDPIFDLAIQKADCPAERCFYTDDIADYIIKARTIGINAEVYSTTSATRSALRALGVPVQP
jgi:putative hydrolase of the HAD superfamily